MTPQDFFVPHCCDVDTTDLRPGALYNISFGLYCDTFEFDIQIIE